MTSWRRRYSGAGGEGDSKHRAYSQLMHYTSNTTLSLSSSLRVSAHMQPVLRRPSSDRTQHKVHSTQSRPAQPTRYANHYHHYTYRCTVELCSLTKPSSELQEVVIIIIKSPSADLPWTKGAKWLMANVDRLREMMMEFTRCLRSC